MSLRPTDDGVHPGATVEEWVFAAWTPDGKLGLLSGHRLLGRTAWYWSAMVHEGFPMLHLVEWDVKVRNVDAFVVKAPEMWAEHHCVAPFDQWTIGNEAYFVALDDPAEALDRGYGDPVPTSFDLEWYATGVPIPIEHGYEQSGVVHGSAEVLGRATVELAEIEACRWHRWTEANELGPIEIGPVVAHTGLRVPFAFPDGTVADWVLTPRGWRSRARRR